MSDEFRIVPTLYNDEGWPYCPALNSPTTNKVRAKCVLPPNQVIPVIFVPGIMGSNLKSEDKLAINGHAWAPDFASWAFKFRKYSGAERKQLLHPERTKVDVTVPPDDGKLLKLSGFTHKQIGDNWKNEFVRRGWGTVMQGSYADLLCTLEYQLNKMYSAGAVAPYWQHLLQKQGHEWGELQGFEKLVQAELSDASEFWYPVHAVGYNWLDSNAVAGKYLAKFIDFYCSRYRTLGYKCEKVILVTHSMGGFVARAAVHSKMGGAQDKVLGIVHGVQPILGAPTAYKRVRAGNEANGLISAITAQVLGWSAAEVSPVFAQSPGPLELLPTKAYPKGWLQVQRHDQGRVSGTSSKVLSLPKKDPYTEIYRERNAWWRLMDPKLIDPASISTKENKTPWTGYVKKLNIAEVFHDDMGDYFHPQSYVYYGADPKHRAWGIVRWISNSPLPKVSDDEMRQARLLQDNLEGRINVKVPNEKKQDAYPFFWSYVIADPTSDGDATVPEESGKAAKGKAKLIARMHGFDHQGSYGNEHVQSFTLYCVAKIAKQAEIK